MFNRSDSLLLFSRPRRHPHAPVVLARGAPDVQRRHRRSDLPPTARRTKPQFRPLARKRAMICRPPFLASGIHPLTIS